MEIFVFEFCDCCPPPKKFIERTYLQAIYKIIVAVKLKKQINGED